MILQYWMTYVIMIIITFVLYWVIAKTGGGRFDLKRALMQAAFACVGLTIYFLILAE